MCCMCCLKTRPAHSASAQFEERPAQRLRPSCAPLVVVCVRSLFEMTIGFDLASCKTVEDAVRRFDEAGDERSPDHQEKVMKWFT